MTYVPNVLRFSCRSAAEPRLLLDQPGPAGARIVFRTFLDSDKTHFSSPHVGSICRPPESDAPDTDRRA